MNNINTMNEARLQKCLKTRLNFGDKILTIEEAINQNIFVRADSFETSKVKYNRHKFNSLGFDQQAEYERKLKEKKTVYALYMADNSFFEVQKMVFDYFNQREKCSTCGKEIDATEHSYGTDETAGNILTCIHCYSEEQTV